MSIHKFGRRYYTSQPKTVYWKPNTDLAHTAQKTTPSTWEIYSQEQMTLTPHSIKTIMLGLGVEMSAGVVITSLKHSLKSKRCSLQNETLLESVPDIVIALQNNSNKIVTINPGEGLCYVHYFV